MIDDTELESAELESKNFTSTRNACKLCTPLGACLVFRGVEGCIPFLHGSQGCATYIRRYLISHFREPIDIASSNFHEESAIFGGASNFKQGIANVMAQYQPQLIGVATTCLAETIGENMPSLLEDLRRENNNSSLPIVTVSTASYRGTHMDGFHAAVAALVKRLAVPPKTPPPAGSSAVNIFPGMVSAADLRHLKEILADFGLPHTILPDYSETMDGSSWSQYEKLQTGGTPVSAIAAMGSARASIEFGRTLIHPPTETPAGILELTCRVPRHHLGLPIGLRETDRFLSVLESLAGHPAPAKYQLERGRLIDSMIDAHKYVFEKRAIVYGEEDLIVGLTAFLSEVGITPVLCATGGKSGRFENAVREAAPYLPQETRIEDGFDFAEIAEAASTLNPDFFLGNSKGYNMARSLGIPLVRVGFPIHDRLGGQRVLHLGYRGAQAMFDQIVNTLLERKQEKSPVGYSYL